MRSPILKRKVTLSLYQSAPHATEYALLLLNDGQDAEAMKLDKLLHRVKDDIQPLMVVAIHAGDRLSEYGVAGMPDYKNRGAEAQTYALFVVQELLPWIESRFPISKNPERRAFAGFSLGGLSAFDQVWNRPDLFSRCGVFSGSFWWRSKALDAGYTDADRIAHQLVRMGKYRAGMRFWFQAGTADESCDRNNNGVIDAIDDTLDLITELIMKGYKLKSDVVYYEVAGGKHDIQTWTKVFPVFLKWAFKK